MLKNKSLVDQFDLVEQLDDQTAQTFNGGVRIKNETGSKQTLYWIHPLSGKCGRLTLEHGEFGTVNKNDVTIIYDRNPYRGQWDPIISDMEYYKDDKLSLILSETNPDLVALIGEYTKVEI